MKIILKNKENHKQQILTKITTIKFETSLISKQIKDCIEPSLQPIKNITINLTKNYKYRQLTQQDYKQSMETTTSSISTRHQSVDKMKKNTNNNPQSQAILTEQLHQLNNRGTCYFMRGRNHISNITKPMRVILGEWLMQLAHQIQIPRDAVYNAIYYTDKYVGLVNVPKSKYQSIGLCALFIASKLQLSSHPNINTFLQAIDGSISKQQLISLQQSMLMKLKFKLNPPTLSQYMILLLSLFNNFITKYHSGYLIITKTSQLYHHIFWILDGIYLDYQYKNYYGKQKVCLSILYLTIKKYKSNTKQKNIKHKKLFHNNNSFKYSTQFQKIFQQFLNKIICIFKKLSDLDDCIQFLKKWIKYQHSTQIPIEHQIQLLKKIILTYH